MKRKIEEISSESQDQYSQDGVPSISSSSRTSIPLPAEVQDEQFTFLSDHEKSTLNRFRDAAADFVRERGIEDCLNVAYIADLIGFDSSSLRKGSKFMLILWITLLQVLRAHMRPEDFKYHSIDDFLSRYNGVFNSERPSEQRKLFQTANWMAVMMRLTTAWKNKCLILDVVAKFVEGWSVKYFTGVGQTMATSNRVHIFETEGKMKQSPGMQRKIFKNPVIHRQQMDSRILDRVSVTPHPAGFTIPFQSNFLPHAQRIYPFNGNPYFFRHPTYNPFANSYASTSFNGTVSADAHSIGKNSSISSVERCLRRCGSEYTESEGDQGVLVSGEKSQRKNYQRSRDNDQSVDGGDQSQAYLSTDNKTDLGESSEVSSTYDEAEVTAPSSRQSESLSVFLNTVVEDAFNNYENGKGNESKDD